MKRLKLNKKWQDFLAKQPESGMGYHKVDVTFKDGTVLKNLTVYNGINLEIPIPYTSDISDICIHGIKKTAIRMRIKPPKRRTPQERLKARLYYRRNRTKIRLQRRRYLRKHKTTLKQRKQLFKRYKPTWFKRPPKHKTPKRPKVRIPKKKSK